MIMAIWERLNITFETKIEKELKVQLAQKQELIKMEVQV